MDIQEGIRRLGLSLFGCMAVALITACGGDSKTPATSPAAGRESPASSPQATEKPATSPTPVSKTTTPSPTAIPGADPYDDAVYWAVDRGSEGTPDEERLRVYLFATADNVGVITLRAPGESAAGTANVLGSGIFGNSSCVVRVPESAPSLRLVGPVIMTEAAQAEFLADPDAYHADVDQRDLGMANPRQFQLPLADSGCRPADP